jgi:hypothetical protein
MMNILVVQQVQTYDFTLLLIEVLKDQALVKIACPLFDHLYDGLLVLLKENRR